MKSAIPHSKCHNPIQIIDIVRARIIQIWQLCCFVVNFGVFSQTKIDWCIWFGICEENCTAFRAMNSNKLNEMLMWTFSSWQFSCFVLYRSHTENWFSSKMWQSDGLSFDIISARQIARKTKFHPAAATNCSVFFIFDLNVKYPPKKNQSPNMEFDCIEMKWNDTDRQNQILNRMSENIE